jgi:hypothetical protein
MEAAGRVDQTEANETHERHGWEIVGRPPLSLTGLI